VIGWLWFYLGSCFGCYVSLAVMNPKMFQRATKIQIAKGMIFTLLWPVVIILAPKEE
jgi:coenzyme F420-reducing hydrogenase gamma subunit